MSVVLTGNDLTFAQFYENLDVKKTEEILDGLRKRG